MSDLVSGGVRRRRRRLVGCLCGLLGLLTACGDDPAPTADAFSVPIWAKVAPEQIAEAKKHGVPVAFENDLGMRFVLIPAGTFLMGSPEDEVGRDGDEFQHEATISMPFYMQMTEVTQGQYQRDGKRTDPEDPDWGRMPADDISWDWANTYASWITRTLEDRRVYTLPTEEQWEYACRAGTTTAFWSGPDLAVEDARICDPSKPDRLEIVREVSRSEWPLYVMHPFAYPVASFAPNAWGLFDMHGNVQEWCSDLYRFCHRPPTEEAPRCENDVDRVVRGGYYDCEAARSRSAARSSSRPSCTLWMGFRLVSPLPEKAE